MFICVYKEYIKTFKLSDCIIKEINDNTEVVSFLFYFWFILLYISLIVMEALRLI
mgnify:CR=1 FL=1